MTMSSTSNALLVREAESLPARARSHAVSAHISSSVRQLWRAYWDQQARRATIMLLHTLDDRALADIGFKRSEIRVCWCSVRLRIVCVATIRNGAMHAARSDRARQGAEGRLRRQLAILPPPFLRMATIGGARRHVGAEVRPAGCRVLEGRFAAERLPVLDAVGGWMLHGDEHGLAIRREARPAHLGPDRHAEEQLGRGRAPRLRSPPRRGRRLCRVLAQLLALVGGDPQPALRIDRAVVGSRRTSRPRWWRDSTARRPPPRGDRRT